jgi:hypothetical protein
MYWYFNPVGVDWINYLKLRPGMNLQEVQLLMGQEGEQTSPTYWVFTNGQIWQEGREDIHVTLDDRRRLEQKWFLGDEPTSFPKRLRNIVRRILPWR